MEGRDTTSRYERYSARLPRLARQPADPPARFVAPRMPDTRTRHQRHTALLPRLSDDPEWRLRRSDLPTPAETR